MECDNVSYFIAETEMILRSANIRKHISTKEMRAFRNVRPIWTVCNPVTRITYRPTVLVETLNHAQSINSLQSSMGLLGCDKSL